MNSESPNRPDLASSAHKSDMERWEEDNPTADDLAAETAKHMAELIESMPEDGIVPTKEEFDRAAIRALDDLNI